MFCHYLIIRKIRSPVFPRNWQDICPSSSRQISRSHKSITFMSSSEQTSSSRSWFSMCHKLSNLLSTCVKWTCIPEIEPTEIDPFRHHPNTERAANGSLGVWELRLYSSGISNWELSMPISKSTRSPGVIWGIGMPLKWEYCVMSTDTGGYLAGMDGTTRTLWICWQNAPSTLQSTLYLRKVNLHTRDRTHRDRPIQAPPKHRASSKWFAWCVGATPVLKWDQ